MRCPNCGSDRINVQAVTTVFTKKHGLAWWLLVGWWIWIFWVLAFLPMLIIKLIRGKKVVSETHSEGVCQNCGYHWKIKKPISKEPHFGDLISNIQKALEHKLKKRVDISEDKSAWSVTKEGLTYSLKSQIKVDGVSKDAHIKIYFPNNTYSNFFFSGIQLDGNDMLHR